MSARRVPGLLSFVLLLLVADHAAAEAAVSAPSSLVATAVSSSQINLAWEDNTNPGSVSYSIERSASSSSGFVPVGSTGRQTAYQDVGLSSGVTYYYRVRALKPGGSSSAYSNIAVAMTLSGDRSAPSVPTGLTASAVGCGQVNLAWNASTDSGGSGLSSYRLYRGGVLVKQVVAPTTSASDVGLFGATPYSYAVSAVDKAGNESVKSVPANVTTGTCVSTTTTSTTSTRPPTTTTSSTSSTTFTTTTSTTVTPATSTTTSTTRPPSTTTSTTGPPSTTATSSTTLTTLASSTTSTTAPPKPPI